MENYYLEKLYDDLFREQVIYGPFALQDTELFLRNFIPFLYFISEIESLATRWNKILLVGNDRRFV